MALYGEAAYLRTFAEEMRQVVRSGTWLYADCVDKLVFLVEVDYDFWYELGKAEGDLEEGEEPELNDHGVLFYICFRSDPTAEPGWVDSPGYKTEEEAMAWAQSKVPTPITWNETANKAE